ncbi:FT-interacting protein 3-like [Impatiens glandulifera]|uniref:FT-interacting protein 3-like n=1 Tax=Impatiens glandulifera TaxID=253017 RepID=UPI001FB08BB4|nr:FT-interacting protein 3-like [Impatiens glandulifera]
MSDLKIGVEVIGARNLMAKDGQGSSNAFVELHLENQRFNTTVKEKDLNPVWNETFYFSVNDPENIRALVLDVYLYNNNKDSFLGKVKINGTSIVPYPDSVVQYYPLEKRGVFSHVTGEIGLKVFQINDPSIKSSIPLPAIESPPLPVATSASSIRSTATSVQDTTRHVFSYLSAAFTSNKKEPKESKHTFHHLPNKTESQQPQTQSQQKPQSQPQLQSYPQANMFSGPSSYQFADFSLKETNPILGAGRIVGGRVIRSDKPITGTYDLVEPMHFLYARVVKAHNLPNKDLTGGLDPFVEVRVGNYKGITRHYEKTSDPEWNEVFAFSKENLQSSVLEVRVKDKDTVKDDCVGFLRFDLNEVPTRVPPDSPLAPEWYRLQNKKGEKKKQGELMMAVWMGTQADEAFPNAIHSDAVGNSFENSSAAAQCRSKVYVSPRLWYVRVNVIEAQDLVPHEKSRLPNVYVKAQIGNQVLKTRNVQTSTMSAIWNEDLMFVAAEPFDDHLILHVEDLVGSNKDETLGKVILPLSTVDRLLDDRMVPTRWYNLSYESEHVKDKFASRLHLRVSLEGGYHVLDESTHYSSDLRPTAKQLWKPSVGILELGILNINGLLPMKQRGDRGTSDTYCVAKYGHKWVRTRSIIDNLNPKYNEQYTWEVFDTATVLTVAVFDNSSIGVSETENGHEKDKKIGKVRIRVSTLETGRVYTHSYPLLVLHPSGVKKMGELHLAIRFTSPSVVNMMSIYTKPLLPKMHYVRPLSVTQLDTLRVQAVKIVAARLGRAEPPLKKEVIEYMTDANSHLWSMRRSKANFYRLISVFNGLFAVAKWFGEICLWKNPITTSLVHVLYIMLVCFPELIFPTAFLYMFMIGIWNYRYRPKYPPHMDTRISCADMVVPDELDEEFDTFPTSRNAEFVRFRYDRLRSIAGRIQTVVGDIASQGERVQALLSWRDPRATVMFIAFCLVSAIVFYTTPFQLLAAFAGFYVMRHPRFRHKLPSAPINFFRRLPARTDSML